MSTVDTSWWSKAKGTVKGWGETIKTSFVQTWNDIKGIQVTKTGQVNVKGDDFTAKEKQEILDARDVACENLEKIIDTIDNYGYNDAKTDKKLSETAQKYLNMHLPEDSEKLANNLTAIKNDLAGMPQDQFVKGTENSWKYGMYTTYDSQGNYYPEIYVNLLAFVCNYSIDEQMVHEESHKVLHTKDVVYETSADLSRINDNVKQNNADNWRKFYTEVLK